MFWSFHSFVAIFVKKHSRSLAGSQVPSLYGFMFTILWAYLCGYHGLLWF